MKKIILPLVLILIISLSGCSKNLNFELGAVEVNESTLMSMSYKLFIGTKEKHITVDEGETVVINADIITEDGSLDAFIYNDELEYSYEGHDIQSSEFTVTLTEPGEYTIKVDAHKHKGSYTFYWE